MIKWAQLDSDKKCVGEGCGDHIPDPSYIDITDADDGFEYTGRTMHDDGSWTPPIIRTPAEKGEVEVSTGWKDTDDGRVLAEIARKLGVVIVEN